MPRHTADLEYIIPALEVYYEEKDWVSTSVYKDKLFEKLKANKKETVRNSDETHYTKCSEIPRYFGLLEREFSGKSSSNVRITESGKSFYEAFVKKDYNSLHAIIMNALEKIRFGRNNEGCGSDTNVEAPNAVIISMLLLDGISNKEAAFVLGELNDKKDSLYSSILKLKVFRESHVLDISSTVTTDMKFIPFLKRINFLSDNDRGLSVVSNEVIEKYRSRLIKLRILNDEEIVGNKDYDNCLREIGDDYSHPNLLTALRTKPFLLLAGISGTGKSRIVREMARACWQPTDDEYKAHKPRNFEMVQVKPNWHDSSELIGYVSRIGEKPEFIAGEFLKFVAKAWSEPNVPYFLCLDEMNLAPVEQYFAEYLSVIESRELKDGKIVTDPLLKKEAQEWYLTLVSTLTNDENLHEQFLNKGISIPQNLFVVGTVNMDETTFSFSRKVLDRAMTIEMNEVDLNGGLDENAASEFGYIGPKDNGEPSVLIPFAVEGKDVYSTNVDLCNKVIEYLKAVNDVLDKTPFKIAYRTRNEFLVYAVCCGEKYLNNALDEMTSMKILSRIEGDAEKTERVLNDLSALLKTTFGELDKSVSLIKIEEMMEKLNRTQYTSFWS